jgi:Mlc titration factor MtfA (ptsG expression regulator)
VLILGLWVVALLAVAWLATEPALIAWRRRKLRAQSFPPAWRDILKQRMPYVRKLPADLQLQLKRHIQVFVAEKEFVGCAGLEISDDIRVTIAAQACLLLLNRRSDYFPGLRHVLVYPDSFRVQRVHNDSAGVLHEQRQVLSGESWDQGKVILSWHDVLQGAAVTDDGRNVVIHEFAHQLDQEDGQANGLPILGRREVQRRWTEVFTREFELLRSQADRQQDSLLDHYGATDPAEFFAVATEAFFEQPMRLADEHPALYELLSGYYRINPLSW